MHLCAGNLFGGVEAFLLTVAAGTPAPGHLRHEFAVCFPGRFRSALRESGAEVHDLTPVSLSKPWQILAARRRLRALARRLQPAWVITHSAWTRLVFGSNPIAGAAPIAWVHGASQPPNWLDRLDRGLSRSLVLTNSRHTASLVESQVPGVTARVVRYPVPPPPPSTGALRERMRASLGAAPGEVVVIIAARLEPWKGHEILIRGLAGLRPSTPWQCWIAGGAQTPAERDWEARLQQLVREHGLRDRVRFLGQRSDVRDLLAAADLHCQPNAGPEPFGIAFVEALHAGLPVVSSDFGGAAEIVDDSCGRLVPPGDAAALASALQRLIDDPALRRALGEAGPRRARELCDPDRQIAAIEDALLGVARSPGT